MKAFSAEYLLTKKAEWRCYGSVRFQSPDAIALLVYSTIQFHTKETIK